MFTDEGVEGELPEVAVRIAEDEGCMLTNIELTEGRICKQLLKLKVGKAPGVDGIVPKVLVECAEALSKPLLMIFSLSLREGKVPMDWKRANVSAIFKKGSKEEAGNYRPVSLTSCVCKVLEALLNETIVKHLLAYSLIKNTQYGFVKGRSCLTNLLVFLEEVTSDIDRGNPVDVIYLDFQKAFDKVPHRRLMEKVKALGIRGEVYNWIKDWLKERQQRVCMDGESSEWVPVSSGVPQGSVLGPLLFLIYINDIDEGIAGKILKFADDTKLFGRVGTEDDINSLREDLSKLVGWSKEWLMLFNVDKCQVLHLGYGNGKAVYTMNGRGLKAVTEEVDLGVIIQSDLKCAKQCAKVVGQANRTLGLIKRTFGNISAEVVVQLYRSLVRPRLEYAVQAWRPHLRKDVDLIERVQRRATKLVKGMRGKSYEDRLRLLQMTTLETRRLRGDMIEVFKILKGFEQVDYSTFFVLADGITRGHELKLAKPRCRLNCRLFSFSNRIVNAWNDLPGEVVACSTVNGFKHKLDKHMKSLGFI